ncbi:lytic transglycosylase domain-containing protein [Methylovorus glucosotrophus]|uniref:Lytic transglycosylase catalytic n=1 Tax=Methylovorus glucosotrophus (strain SIP3-4) TaxID=582744 RepID=C6X6R8_METGS|nr:lytic transglycosylase domain-containing protein [Methylovorus glucosotrophus]ACT51061.1 Lytic transglycosylase catalytic [Methylovorus glucosotrophus SIP3-4]KAF0843620.1 transglycosylase-like protein with SLT domain [Methylovorus glucosotrophus]
MAVSAFFISALPVAWAGDGASTESIPCGVTTPYQLQPSADAQAQQRQTLSAKPHAKSILSAARSSGLDPCLVHALISVESGYRQDAISSKGAMGLMQVLPETGNRVGVKNSANSVSANLKAGTRYFSLLQKKYPGRLDLAIAAYNAGEGAVEKYGNEIPPYAETQAYVPKVMAQYEKLSGKSIKKHPQNQPRKYIEGTTLAPSTLKSYRMTSQR